MSEKEMRSYDAWVDLDFDFSSVELTLQITPEGRCSILMNGTVVDHADSVEALRDDSFQTLCREINSWIEDEVWSFIDDAVNMAWDVIESDKAYDEEEDDDE